MMQHVIGRTQCTVTLLFSFSYGGWVGVWTLSSKVIEKKPRDAETLLPLLLHRMGWQKAFTLSKRAKGCHLVTDEILAQIRPGLQDVQVSGGLLCVAYLTYYDLIQDWNAIPFHVSHSTTVLSSVF